MNTILPFTAGDTVVAYLRDSGHENQDMSIEQQSISIKDFCNKSGLILQQLFIDEARKGSDVKRQALDNLMNFLRHKPPIAGVLVWSNSRFARNVNNAQFYRAEIRNLGYIFYSITDQISLGPESIIIEAIIDYKNQQFLVDLSIDIKRGLRQLVEQYGCIPGNPPVGFMREKVILGSHRDGKPRIAHRWIVDPDVSDRVRQAFELRAGGASLGQIKSETNLFSSVNSFRTFFSNPIYKGEFRFGDDLIVEHYCEPIVDKLTYEQVQAIQNKYQHHRNLAADSSDHPRRIASKYLLSGLVHCALCGSPLFGHTHIQKSGKTTISYFCTRAYNRRDCIKKRIPGKTVEQLVIDMLEKKLQEPAYLDLILQEYKIKNATLIEEQQRDQKKITRELGEVRRQQTNLTTAIAETGHNRAMLNRMADLEIRETELLNQLTRMQAAAQREVQPVDRVGTQMIVDYLRNQFPQDDIQTQRAFLRGLIKRVDIDRDDRHVFGKMEIYIPESNKTAPSLRAAGGSEKYARISSTPPGAPRYTCIFEISVISKRYEKPH